MEGQFFTEGTEIRKDIGDTRHLLMGVATECATANVIAEALNHLEKDEELEGNDFHVSVKKKKHQVWKDKDNDMWYIEGHPDGFTTVDELFEQLEAL